MSNARLTGIKGSAFLGAAALATLSWLASHVTSRLTQGHELSSEFAMGVFVAVYGIGALVMLFGSTAILRRLGLIERSGSANGASGTEAEDNDEA